MKTFGREINEQRLLDKARQLVAEEQRTTAEILEAPDRRFLSDMEWQLLQGLLGCTGGLVKCDGNSIAQAVPWVDYIPARIQDVSTGKFFKIIISNGDIGTEEVA